MIVQFHPPFFFTILHFENTRNRIRSEDREILWEGVNSLNEEELFEACKIRAIRFHDVDQSYMRQQVLRISMNKLFNSNCRLMILRISLQAYLLRVGSDFSVTYQINTYFNYTTYLIQPSCGIG